MKRNIIRKNTSLNGISIERQIEIPDYDMTLLKLSTMTPYLEGRRVHKTLDHNKKKSNDQNLVIKYNVEDDSEPTQLYVYYVAQQEGEPSALGVDMFDKVLIDGIEVPVTDLDAAEGKYQLSAGEHTVSYTLKDPTIIGSEIDAETEMLLKAGAVLSRCDAITNVTIPNSVTTIGDTAFYQCSGLTSIDIPNSVTTIGAFAFQECTSLTSINIPNSVTSIGTSAFQGCSNLTNVTIPNSITSINGYVFSLCTSLTSIVIPNSVISIDDCAFSNCSGLTSITIPNSVISIGQNSFSGTPWWNTYSVDTANQYGGIIYINDVAYKAVLTSIANCEFREGTISIGSDAFGNCSRLTNVTIPASVTRINGIAFNNCTSLTSITVESTTPPTLDFRVFYHTNDCPIYVPSESVDAYKTARWWEEYASRIQAIQDDGGETAVK